MSTPLAPLGARFEFNSGLFGMLADGLDEADWGFRPEGGGNTPHWVLGHLAVSRRSLRRQLGDDLPPESWEQGFGRGTAGDLADDAPTTERLARDFVGSGEKLAELLGAVDAEGAASTWEAGFPDGSTTLEGGCHFMYFHEAYHLGQLGYARAGRGKGGIP